MCQQALYCLEGVDLETAKRIMGSNFVDIADLRELIDQPFSKDDVDFFSTIPFPMQLLEKNQNSHILVPGLSMSVLDVYRTAPAVRFLFDSDPWWFQEDFATSQKTERKWYLLRRSVLPESTGQPYGVQVQVVRDSGEEIAKGCELICAMVFYYLVTGIRLFERVKSNCADFEIDGIHFHVGFFQKGHIDARGYRDLTLQRNVGMTGMSKADFSY